MSWHLGLAVAGGSALGGVLRFGVARWLEQRMPGGIPLATWLVNVLGSAALCWLAARQLRLPLSPPLYAGLTTGVLGGFTTYSTFNGELVRKLLDGRTGEAALYLGATVAACLAGGLCGAWLARA
jgi:CrcB protein